MTKPWKPTREQLLAATEKTVKDVIAPNLRVLFCGINPGLYTAAVGHHFARPGNRFWPALYAGGFTDRLLSPFDERDLLVSGYGITNVVARATASADALTKEEIIAGGEQLRRKVRRYRPRVLALLGVGAYRTAFNRPKACVGRQDETMGETILWILPNPSGLNANYQAPDLARLFRELKEFSDRVWTNAELWTAFSGNDRTLMWEAAKALSRLKSRSLVPKLIASLKSKSTEHRAAAAYVLGMTREPRAVSHLEVILADTRESPSVRGHAAEALAYLKKRRSFHVLLSALDDPEPEVRWWAAFALGELGDKRALPELKRIGSTDNGKARDGSSVRGEARRAWKRLAKQP